MGDGLKRAVAAAKATRRKLPTLKQCEKALDEPAIYACIGLLGRSALIPIDNRHRAEREIIPIGRRR